MAAKIPLNDWIELEKAVKAASSAIRKAQTLASDRMLKHRRANQNREAEIWREIEQRLQNTQHELSPSLFYIQSEWTGGDIYDPMNFTLREPSIVGITHAFPPEEVAVYRDEQGVIRLPYREEGEE